MVTQKNIPEDVLGVVLNLMLRDEWRRRVGVAAQHAQPHRHESHCAPQRSIRQDAETNKCLTDIDPIDPDRWIAGGPTGLRRAAVEVVGLHICPHQKVLFGGAVVEVHRRRPVHAPCPQTAG